MYITIFLIIIIVPISRILYTNYKKSTVTKIDRTGYTYYKFIGWMPDNVYFETVNSNEIKSEDNSQIINQLTLL